MKGERQKITEGRELRLYSVRKGRGLRTIGNQKGGLLPKAAEKKIQGTGGETVQGKMRDLSDRRTKRG